jgi:hypothetical protein
MPMITDLDVLFVSQNVNARCHFKEVMPMAAVIIDQVKVHLTVEQLLSIIQQLSPEDKERIRKELAAEPWENRLDALLRGVRSRVEENEIQEEEIIAEVESVRAAHYDQSSH